jgi:dTMP kinase
MLKNNSYGGERYEKRDLQIRVRKRFAELQALDEEQGRVPWHVVDASQSIEDVTKEIASIVTDTVERIAKDSSPLRRMWEDGEYELPECKAEEKKDD